MFFDIYYVSSTILGASDTATSRTARHSMPHGVYMVEGER